MRTGAGRDHDQVECRRDDQVHRRACQGHPEFLSRVIGHALQASKPSDREQRDVPRADAVFSRRQSVPKLVEDDTSENQEHKKQPSQRRRQAAPLIPVRVQDEQNEQPEGGMDVNANAR